MQNISTIKDYAFLLGYMKNPLWEYDDEFMGLKLRGSFYIIGKPRKGREKNHLFGWHILPLFLYCVSTFHNEGDKCPAPNAYPLTMEADITWLKAQGPVGKEAQRIKSIRHG